MIILLFLGLDAAGKRDRRIDDNAARRKMAPKFAADARLAVNEQVGLVPAQHMLDDGQSQADAAVFAGPATIDTEKALCQARNMLGSHALSRVGHD